MRKWMLWLCLVWGCGAQPLHVPVMVDVPSGDVRAVLRMIADAHGVSVVIPGDLAGEVSVRLDGVSLDDAYRAILAPLGYQHTTKGKLVVVAKREPAQVPEKTLARYRLRHRSGAEVEAEVGKLARDGESVQLLGTEVVIWAAHDRADEMLGVLEGLDTERRQIVVECRMQEMETGLSKKVGFSWSQAMEATVSAEAVTLGEPPMTAILSLSQLSAVLALAESSTGARQVSSPRLLARDGETATVNVGRQYPLPQYQFSSETGVMQVSGFEYKDVGVALAVTPHFVDEGESVVLDLAPEVSSVVSTSTFGGIGAAELPVIATRSVRTRVQLRDGETVALSGLRTEEDSSGETKVPGISKVPVFGRLFRTKSKATKEVELVMLVTVRFVGGQRIEAGGDGQ